MSRRSAVSRIGVASHAEAARASGLKILMGAPNVVRGGSHSGNVAARFSSLLILSAEMMLRHLGWLEAADLIVSSIEAAIGDGQVTYDFARLMEGSTEVKCSEFGDNIIAHM